MPRGTERQSRRGRGLCVECDMQVDTARCEVCKAKERDRAETLRTGERRSYQPVYGVQRPTQRRMPTQRRGVSPVVRTTQPARCDVHEWEAGDGFRICLECGMFERGA